MRGRLTPAQLDYVLEHLSHHAELGSELLQLITYGDKPLREQAGIHFPASEEELILEKVIWVDELPILYPLDEASENFFIITNNHLRFCHDLLKSIFHLLSAYEEVKNGAADQYGRFPYKESLQYKLGIIDKPVVNYYMEIVLDGIRQFCKINGLPFRKNPVFHRPILMLSHDVDLIDSYSFRETGYKFKQLLGMADSPFGLKGKIRDAFTALYHFLNPFSKKNPFWSFGKLNEWESERGFRSTYFFLEKDGKYENSRYRFHYPRIQKLINSLSARGHEIGIHGTMQSFDNLEAMKRTLNHLSVVAPRPVVGIRQHFLRFSPNHTARIQARCGLIYDASLGFAEHEGFRNSYCWPFKFFDFDKQQTMDYWEIPLALMDISHFHYRKLNFVQSRKSLENLAAEVLKFNGILSLLWHNSFFNEWEFPGITKHYIEILDHLKSLGMEGLTGEDIISQMKGRQIG